MAENKIVTAGVFLCSVVNDIPYCCAGIDGGWIGPYPQSFPGGKVKDFAGNSRAKSDGTGLESYLFILGEDNRVWITGLPGGFVTIASPPFKAVRLLGAYDQYLIAEDDTKKTWVIGNVLDGGNWVPRDNLKPPF